MKRDGAWIPLDPSLHTNNDGSLSPNATSGDVRLSGGGSGPLMVLSGAAHQISLAFPLALPKPSVVGNTATYPQVLPGVDLAVTVDNQGSVSEVLVVKSSAAARNPALHSLKWAVGTHGLSVHSDKTGNLTFNDQSGHTVYSAPSPTMWDSTAPPSSVATTNAPSMGTAIDNATGLPAHSTPRFPGERAHRAPIGVAANNTAITLTPDSSLLTGPGTAYPVYIDPTITFTPDSFGAAADWTEVESGYPSYTGWHQSGYEQVGDCDWSFCNGIGVTRSYFQFPTGPLRGTIILSSQLNFVEEYSPTCTLPGGHNGTVDLFFTGGVGPGTNWSNKPGTIGGPIGSDGGMDGYDAIKCPAKGLGFDVTRALQSFLGQTNGAITFDLQADNESDAYGWKEFNDSATWSTTYDVTPVTPFSPAPSPAIGCTTQKPYPIIGTTDLYLAIDTARASDGIAKPLNVDLRVLNSSGGIANDATIQVTAGSWVTNAIAKGTFATGDYTWSAQATDGALTSAWSAPCGFHVDTSQPGTPVVTPTSPSGCTVQECDVPARTPITLSFTPSAGSSTPTAYRYQINSGAPVTVTASNGNWTGTITPIRVGPNTLAVQALSAAGTPSALAARFNLTAQAPSTPDADGDFTGDGHPDLLTAGRTDEDGLWLSAGDGTGKLGNPTDIGIRGNGLSTSGGAPRNWNGAVLAHGQFYGDGMQDILAMFAPTATGGSQTAEIYRGTGDGSALNPVSGNINGLQGICLTDPNWSCLTSQETVTQLTAMGHLPEDQCAPSCDSAYPDLFAVVNDAGNYQLWWFQSAEGLGNYDAAVVLDSTQSWQGKSISGTTYNGQPALEVYDGSTDEIDLYTTNTTTNAQNVNWLTDATKTVMRTTSVAQAGPLNATDANRDGQPDAWLTNPGGNVTFYAGGAGGVLGNALAAGTTVATNIPMTSFGSVSWKNPATGSNQVDVYTADNNGNLWQSTEASSGTLGPPTLAATGWTHYRSVGIADMNHDGYPDLVAIDTNTNNEDVFPGSATGLNTTPTVLGTGWTGGYTLWGIADWNHDGHYDTITSDLNGTLWEYPGDLTGGDGSRVSISTGWTSADVPFGIGDFTDDGHTDLAVCNNNNLVLYLGDGTGGSASGLTRVTTAGAGCTVFRPFGVADYFGDGHSDLITFRTDTGTVSVNAVTGAFGSFASNGTVIATNTPALTGFGAVTWTRPTVGGTQVDVYAADSSGNLWDYTEQSDGTLSTPTVAATGWTHYRSVGLADMNHDGYPDLIAIDTNTNDEDVFPGSANGLSTTPIVLGVGWTGGYTPWGIVDWNHDGYYDTIASDLNGTLWEYPGDLKGGVGARVSLSTGWTSTISSFGIGDFNDDNHSDILACRNDVNALTLYPGDGTGGNTGVVGMVLTDCAGDTPLGATPYNVYSTSNLNGMTPDTFSDVIVRDKTTGNIIVGLSDNSGWLSDRSSYVIASGW